MYNKAMLLSTTVPDGRVFALDAQTMISVGIQLLNGIILAVALGFIFYKPLKNFMQNRTEKIQRQIDDADTKFAEAKELASEYDRKIKDIEKKRIEIIEDARIKADEEKRLILEEARQEAAEIKRRSSEKMLEEQKRLQEETRIHIIELSSIIAEKYISQAIVPEIQDRIFEETLAKMEDAKWLG